MQNLLWKKKSIYIFLAMICLITLSFILSGVSLGAINASADTDNPFANTMTGATMSVTAYDETGTVLSANSKNINISGTGISLNLPASNYAWKHVKYFKVEMGNLSTALGTAVDSKYQYHYDVTFFPSIADGASLEYDTASIIKARAYPSGKDAGNYAISESKETITNAFYFFIDDNLNLNEDENNNNDIIVNNKKLPSIGASSIFTEEEHKVYTSQGGWGTYVFTFTCNDQVTSGNKIYEVTPSKLADLSASPLSVNAEKDSSSTSINNAYIFSVSEDYKYINREYITWKITGTGSDGTKYVLIEDDKTAENEKPLFLESSVKRTGATFKLDTSVQGTWVAKAIIDDPTDGVGINMVNADSEEVSTIKPFSTEAIIWIVTAITVIAIAVVAIVIVTNIKKEKTW